MRRLTAWVAGVCTAVLCAALTAALPTGGRAGHAWLRRFRARTLLRLGVRLLANQYGFVVIYPSASKKGNCFDSWSAESHLRGGGMETNIMLGNYPDVFKAGAVFMGVPHSCFANEADYIPSPWSAPPTPVTPVRGRACSSGTARTTPSSTTPRCSSRSTSGPTSSASARRPPARTHHRPTGTAAATPTPPTGACRVTYTPSTWNNGFTATVTQQGAQVTARNAPYNATVAAGAAVTFGFQATYSGTNTAPAQFALNGTVCSPAA